MKKFSLLFLLSATLLSNTAYVVNAEATDVPAPSTAESLESLPTFSGFEAEGLPNRLIVGQTGQLKRPATHYLAETQYSFDITVSDPSSLTVNEKGEWQALKPGTVTVYYQLSDYTKNPDFEAELAQLGLSKEWLIQEIAMEPITVTIQDNKVTLFRLYNPNSGEHFYTSVAAERDNLNKIGWNYEDEAWNAPTQGQDVYRLYNPNAGDHHYTLSAGERDHLVKLGWQYEGVNWYSGGQKPVYRLYNPNAKKAGSHHYTLSAGERDHLVKLGWRDEGIGWYAE